MVLVSSMVTPPKQNPAAMPKTTAKPSIPNVGMFASYLAKLQPPGMGGGLPNMPTMGAMPNMPNLGTMGGSLPSMPAMGGALPSGAASMFGNPEMSIDQFGQKFGFDYSKDYANQQANTIKQAKTDAYNNQLRQIQSGVSGSVNNLDRDYYKNMLRQDQQQVNSGVNAGIAADQDLRLAMNRQNAMGDIYRDANNQNAAIQDNLGRLDAEALASADQTYNDRRQQAYQNTQSYNQLQTQNAGAYADYMRNVTNDNRNYAIQEGGLMGNYIPYEARSLVETVLKSKDQLTKVKNPLEQQQILTASNDARIKLASMGVNVDQIGTTSTFNDALGSISSMNKTMDGQNNDMNLANQVAAQTGVFTDPRTQQLYQTLLGLKSNVERKGGATQAEANEMTRLRGELAGMGVPINNLAGQNTWYGTALSNATKLGTQTLGSKLQSANIRQADSNIANDKSKITNDFKLGTQANQNDRIQIDDNYKLGNFSNVTDRTKAGYDYSLGKVANANDANKINKDFYLGKVANANDANKINNDFALGTQANSNDANQIANTYAIDTEKNSINKQLGEYDYKIKTAENDYKKAQVEIDKKKAIWDKQGSDAKTTAKAATDAVTAELMGMSKAEAIASFGKYYKNWINKGVDVIKVMDALGLTDLMKPASKAAAKGGKDPLADLFGGK